MSNTALEKQERTTPEAVAERTRNRRALVPRTDIFETPDSMVLLANMPGVSTQNVDIVLEKNVLTVEGVVSEEAPQGYSLAHREWIPADFRRSFTLSTEIDRDHIQASVKDGVLRLVLPKAAAGKPKKIAVRGE